MTQPINLNKARKARARTAEKAQAAENRVRFGQSKAEKAVSKLESDRARRSHEGTKRVED